MRVRLSKGSLKRYSLLDSVKFAWVWLVCLDGSTFQEGYTYFENWEEHIGLKERRAHAMLFFYQKEGLEHFGPWSMKVKECLQWPEEPFLGRGLALPQPLGALRLFFEPKEAARGTVLLLHGSEEDWLGNRAAVAAGATEVFQALQQQGFRAVLLDSFFDGRKQRLIQEP